MELSTQMLLNFDAIQKGLHFEILDEQDQFLKLWHKDHVSTSKMVTWPQKDNYVVPLAMANKIVTKNPGWCWLPRRQTEFTSLEQRSSLLILPSRASKWGFKQKSTNFGLGISIFKSLPALITIRKLSRLPLQKIQLFLLKFIPGTEYRSSFWTGVVKSVARCVAANICRWWQTHHSWSSHPEKCQSIARPWPPLTSGNH